MALEDFREFLKKYPKLKEVVDNKSMTYQQIYNNWRMFGDDGSYDKYRVDGDKVVESPAQPSTAQQSTTPPPADNIKQILDFVKGIKPESINNTLNTVQKVMSIFQTMSQSKAKTAQPFLSDSLFKNDFKRFD